MSKERLAAFTDAVLAIIMTIIVLELPKPDPVTPAGLWSLRASFFSYALSFFWLGAMWAGIHNEWNSVKEITDAIIWRVLILLFFASLFPYATLLVAGNFFNRTAQGFYGIVVVLATLVNMWLSRGLAAIPANAAITDSVDFRLSWLSIDLAVKALGFVLAVIVFPPAMMVAVLVTSFMIAMPAHFWEGRQRRKAREGVKGKMGGTVEFGETNKKAQEMPEEDTGTGPAVAAGIEGNGTGGRQDGLR